MNKLLQKQTRRDELIIELWSVLNAISFMVPIDDMTNEDMSLWSKVVEHSAIKNRCQEDNREV